jgi:putative NIF3 family GTP cyclohydrolase 1 type 2
MSYLSRRKFSALASAGTLIAPGAYAQRAVPHGAISASDIVDRIRGKVGVPWKAETVDTFKAGDQGTVVKGIAVTTMATMEVLKKSVAAGANMVITAEPTYFGKADNPDPPPGRGQTASATPDAVLAAKKDFILKNSLVVWRFSDHWRLYKPDPLAQGLADAMGWSKYQLAGDTTRFDLPAVTLDSLAGDLKKKLGIRGGMRIVGDPRSEIRKIGLLTGTTPLAASLKTMPEVDAIVAGEVREWESVEYAHDTVTAGLKKGMILLGRVVSEEPGMKLCASWLRTFVSEVPVAWIAVGDPYWRPV